MKAMRTFRLGRAVRYAAVAMMTMMTANAMADNIAINKENFPNLSLRTLVGNYDANKDGYLSESEIAKIKSVKLIDTSVESLKGIEYLTALTELDCHCNFLTEVDLSNNKALKTLNCMGNQLSVLDLSNNTALTNLECASNQLSELDLKNHTALKELNCSGNQLSVLDLSNSTALEEFHCNENKLESLDVKNNTALKTLGCYENSLTKLDLKNNTALEWLDCSDNQLSALDLSNNKVLEWLGCSDNQLSAIDLSNNKALKELHCSGNNISGLDLSNNTELEGLYCSKNQLSALDLSNCTALKELDCSRNQLSALNLSNNTALKELYCSENYLTALSLSIHTALEELYCSKNLLTILDISNNKELSSFKCDNNRLTSLILGDNTWTIAFSCNYNELTSLNLENVTELDYFICDYNEHYLDKFDMSGFSVEGLDMTRVSNVKGATVVDGKFVPESASTTVITYTYDTKYADPDRASLEFSLVQKVDEKIVVAISEETFPDAAFREYVSKSFDKDMDGNLSNIEIARAQKVDICEDGLKTLKGIEYLTALKELSCDYNQLTELDLSHNTALVYLECDNNQLTSLNLEKNTALKHLECDKNRLTSLDLSNCTALEELDCHYNQLTALDLSRCTALEEVDCYGNNLTSLDVENNTKLEYLDCDENKLDMGDVDFTGFSVEGLDMTRVSDVKGATVVEGKFVPSSKETTEITYNYDTKCADEEYAIQEFMLTVKVSDKIVVAIDKGHFPDAAFREYVSTNFDKNTDGFLSYFEIDDAQEVVIDGKGVETLKGIEYLTALETLSCGHNSLTMLDLKNNKALDGVDCSNNKLTSLDLSNNTALVFIDCGYNYLTSLDLSNNTELVALGCDYNNITSLDLSNNTNLMQLQCYNNELTSLDLEDKMLVTFNCDYNERHIDNFTMSGVTIEGLDMSRVSNVKGATVVDGKFMPLSTNTTQITYTYNTKCENERYASQEFTLALKVDEKIVVAINEENFPNAKFRNHVSEYFDRDKDNKLSNAEIAKVKDVDLSDEGIETLKGIEYLTSLKELYCSENQLTELNISSCTALKVLTCYSNTLTSLNLENNTELEYLNCKYNVVDMGEVGLLGFSVEGLDMTRVSDVNGAKVKKGKFVPTSRETTEITYKYDTKWANEESASQEFKLTFTVSDQIVVAIDEEHFPDAKFREDVSKTFDQNKDGSLSDSEIAMAQMMEVSYEGIESLKGIEYLTELTLLGCVGNKLTSLDLSKNTALTEIICSDNNLSELNLEKNTELESLYCEDNKLTTLDVSNNTALKVLDFDNNKLTTLDISENKALENLDCNNNKLTTLDISKNTALEVIDCGYNSLTEIDFSNNTELKTISCESNQLTSLDVSNIKGLEELYCNNNMLVSIDLEDNKNLYDFHCQYNERPIVNFYMAGVTVEGLDMERVSNVKGGTISNGKFVPDSYSTTEIRYTYDTKLADESWASVEFSLVLKERSETKVVAINEKNFPDDTFREYVSLYFDKNDDNYLSNVEITKAKELYLRDREIESFKGIEHLTALRNLVCYENNLTELDLSKNTKLEELNCSNNQLTELNLEKNTELKELNCNNNKLTELNLEKNTELESLYCNNNQLTELDLESNTALIGLYCSRNKLTELDLEKNTKLLWLYCNNNQLTELDLENNTALETLRCSGNVRDMGEVDFEGFSVEGLDMKRVSAVKGATVVDGKFVPTYPNIEEITYTYDTKSTAEESDTPIFTLKIEKATTTAIETIDAQKKSKAVKTIENGQIVIVKDGVKYNVVGRRIR